VDKTFITPGRLYARLGEEFRRLRAPECACCEMPMVCVIDPYFAEHGNWEVDAMPHGCAPCRRIVCEIVRRHTLRYDINDPTATPIGHPVGSNTH
jgi:hypothetical protein